MIRELPEELRFVLYYDLSTNKIRKIVDDATIGYFDTHGNAVLTYKKVVYQAARVVYFLTNGIQPERLSFRDGDKTNLHPDNLINKPHSTYKAVVDAWKRENGYVDIPNVYPTYQKGFIRFVASISKGNVKYTSTFSELNNAIKFVLKYKSM